MARASCASPTLTPAQRLAAFGDLPTEMREGAWRGLRVFVEQREAHAREDVVK